MCLGLGVLRLPPESFWAMTMHELLVAWEGYADSHGIERNDMPDIDGDKLHEMLKNDVGRTRKTRS